MDIVARLREEGPETVTTVDFHTAGEATRVVVSGFPKLSGTLLEQRREYQEDHDHLRRRIILEPRGHSDMYGAVLIQDTELVASGEADIGVLFMTNDGWSTMCGHATIALGRFLVDTKDETLFPGRSKLRFDPQRQEVVIRLHAPCGVVTVTVQTNREGTKSDQEAPVCYESVPSFATALKQEISIPQALRWPQLGARGSIVVDFAYGGAFYAIVSAEQLGFSGLNLPAGGDAFDLEAFRKAAEAIMDTVNANETLKACAIHSTGTEDLDFLYSVLITDGPHEDFGAAGIKREAETGLCFFADSQVDRSPTGSGVQARVALGYAQGMLSQEQEVHYHSLVTRHFDGDGYFSGEWIREVENPHGTTDLSRAAVIVRVSGWAYCTGTSIFIVERDRDEEEGGLDVIGECAFSMKEVCRGSDALNPLPHYARASRESDW